MRQRTPKFQPTWQSVEVRLFMAQPSCIGARKDWAVALRTQHVPLKT